MNLKMLNAALDLAILAAQDNTNPPEQGELFEKDEALLSILELNAKLITLGDWVAAEGKLLSEL